MSFLLDSDICSLYLKGNGRIHNRLIQHSGGLSLSTVALAELGAWAYRRDRPKRIDALNEFLTLVTVLPLTVEIAELYGRTLAALLDVGEPKPRSDLLIASTALYHDLTLVTHNIVDFEGVPGLRFVDWSEP